jgi:signal transduction histidine kinase
MINSLFLRVYLSAIAFLLVIFFLLMFVLNYFVYDKQLIEDSISLQHTIEKGLADKDPPSWENEVKTYNALEKDFSLSLVTWNSLSEKERAQLEQAKDHRIISQNTLGEKDLYTLSKLKGSSHWVLKISEANDDGDESTKDWIDLALVFSMIFFSLAFTLFLLIRKLTKPVDHLVSVAAKLGKGERQARARDDLPPPMNTLARGFNHMAEELNETLLEQQVLIGAIPHELRSPLGRIRFALDLSRSSKTAEALREDIEAIDGYVDDMQEAVDEILELNRLQNQAGVEASKFDLCELINAQIEHNTANTEDLKFSVDCQLLPNSVSGNASLLKRAIENLLGNARRYAKANIHIKVWQDNTKTHIRVDDDGIGIPDDKLSEVFTPFLTLDQSRNRSKGGIGLGLSIVKIIMKKHQGDVLAGHSDMGGACFELFW